MRIYRNIGFLLFQFLIPTFQIVVFCLAIGRNLKGIKLAYTNDDTFAFPLELVCNNTDIDNGLINVTNLGQLYVDKLLHDDAFDMVSLCVCHFYSNALR